MSQVQLRLGDQGEQAKGMSKMQDQAGRQEDEEGLNRASGLSVSRVL